MLLRGNILTMVLTRAQRGEPLHLMMLHGQVLMHRLDMAPVALRQRLVSAVTIKRNISLPTSEKRSILLMHQFTAAILQWR
jgi:hypothetical protein